MQQLNSAVALGLEKAYNRFFFFSLDDRERPQGTDNKARLGGGGGRRTRINVQKIHLILSSQVEVIYLKGQQSLV